MFPSVLLLLLLLSPLRPIDAQATVALRNGVVMPTIAAGVWEYNATTARASVSAALNVGFRMIDTALDYHNQDGVGRAIADSGLKREDIFVETKVPGCGGGEGVGLSECAKKTAAALAEDLTLLNLTYVDLVLLHFPPLPTMINPWRTCEKWECSLIQGQWRALEDFYRDNKARAIGVSNYCPSCFACVFENATVMPMVNQVQYHIGMGRDPDGFKSFADAHGVVLQAYSALGTSDSPDHDFILHGNLTRDIGAKYNKSPVQVALKYIVQQGIPAITKSANPSHLADDLDLFSWNLTADDVQALDAYVDDHDHPSFACRK